MSKMQKNKIQKTIEKLLLLVLAIAAFSINTYAAQDFIIENKIDILFVELIIIFVLFSFKNKKEEKPGSQKQAIEPQVSSHPFSYNVGRVIYKFFDCVKPGWQKQALRLPQEQVGSHPSGFKTSFVEVPALAHNKLFNSAKSLKLTLSFVLILFLLILPDNIYAAQDFIIENRTSALFVVNGTTGNIIAISFGLVLVVGIRLSLTLRGSTRWN